MGFFIAITQKLNYNKSRFVKDKELVTEYARLNERINRLEIEVQTIRKDINELEETKQTSTELKIQYENIEKMLSEVRIDVKNLQAKPTKYWDNIIIALTAGGIGFIVSKLFGV